MFQECPEQCVITLPSAQDVVFVNCTFVGAKALIVQAPFDVDRLHISNVYALDGSLLTIDIAHNGLLKSVEISAKQPLSAGLLTRLKNAGPRVFVVEE